MQNQVIDTIKSIARVEARPVRNGYQVVAIDLNGAEHIVKKGGALRCTAHFYDWQANGNGQGLSAFVQCAKTPKCESVIRSIKIEVAA